MQTDAMSERCHSVGSALHYLILADVLFTNTSDTRAVLRQHHMSAPLCTLATERVRFETNLGKIGSIIGNYHTTYYTEQNLRATQPA